MPCYGGNFRDVSAASLSGAGHEEHIGDSQTTPSLDYLFWDAWPRWLGSRVRWSYFVANGQSASQCCTNNLGYASIGTPATNDSGGSSAHTTYEVPAATPVSARILVPCRVHQYGSNAADAANFGSGIYLPRQITSVPAHSNAQRNMPWPTLPDNGAQPWFHGTHMKGKLVQWIPTAANLDEFNLYILRQGTSANNSGSVVGHTNAAAADTIAATAWSNPVADLGTYDVSGNGVRNDHEVALRLSAKAGYDETGKILIPMAAVFARCDAGGVIPANADGSYCGYSAIGRAGCYVSSWLNYCTQADWQGWFAATQEGATPTLIDCYMMGHNVNPGTSDVGDGDGLQYEQFDGVATAYWKKRYKALIERRRDAFLAEFPGGRYIGPLVIVPWATYQGSAMDITVPGRIESVNTYSKEIASELSGAWFSFVDYFRAADGSIRAPFYNLHPWTAENGRVLAAALGDGMDRSTNFAYSPQGRIVGAAPRGRLNN